MYLYAKTPVMIKSAFNVVVFICLTALASCSSGYQESHKEIFKDQIWTKGEEIAYKPLIHDNSVSKQISIDLQHIYGYNMDGFDVEMTVTAPSGNEEYRKTYYIKMKNADGSYISDCGGDYCDLKQVLEQNYQFKETGEYTFTFTQATNVESIAGFLSMKLLMPK